MSEPTSITRGWFKATRSAEPIELIRANHNAFVLAYVIAYRARWRDGFNEHNLGQGEAFLGDFENYGMTERNYRTAKEQLSKWHFATFKTTNKGTIGKLIDTRLFSTSIEPNDGQNDSPPTGNRRTTDGQPTTNEERKKGKNVKTEKKKQSAAPPVVIPESLTAPTFIEAWGNWLDHLKQKRKPATAHAQELQLKKLAALGPVKAIETLNNCIEKNWQGIYDNTGTNPKRPAQTNPRNAGISTDTAKQSVGIVEELERRRKREAAQAAPQQVAEQVAPAR